ncbi:putative mannan endo-1,4-beta-mannosidase 9 [Hordeum vulgare subsp. vulgare]|uniref:mannan endo-1,4-beta-mannosidase n=1 Tax=Hordeum vulgare subsp. vulgare TaxID=112509 RepID=A0A8I6Y6X7_HORVV|nr:putative mannan endo-1,4-beta-mannosidase 9 [Hordeum vulgare subsp. vulgare]
MHTYIGMGTGNVRRLMAVSCLAVLALAADARRPSVHHAVVPAQAPALNNAGELGAGTRGFARADGARFTVGGRPFYPNGFNAYWLMYMASNPGDRSKVLDTLDQASRVGATIIRTWAFNDGGSNRPLQITPGVYSEEVFVGVDFVVAEAKKRGLYLILSLTNNWGDFGGKRQYVQWAKEQGHNLSSDDDFFTDRLTQRFYMNHIKRVLTRVNNFTGVAYKDEPTIFAWELMNEPRVPSDLSGKTMQAWVALMSSYVKSIDDKHMVEIGLEGFYGDTAPERRRFNPGGSYSAGTDFIGNNRIPTVDFATIHSYPDQWVPGSTSEQQVEFMKKWMASHIEDAAAALRKPLLVAEFGWKSSGNAAVAARDDYLRMVYDAIYASVKGGGPCAGGLFWQVMAPGMESWADGYEVVLERSSTTAAVVSQECARIGGITP